MKDEFENAFANYNAMYFNALTNPRIGSGTATTKTPLGLTANNLKQVGYEKGRHIEDLE